MTVVGLCAVRAVHVYIYDADSQLARTCVHGRLEKLRHLASARLICAKLLHDLCNEIFTALKSKEDIGKRNAIRQLTLGGLAELGL